MERYSIFGNLIAKEGHQEELLGYLLDAAEGMKKIDDCYCYIVGINPEEKNAIYVFEVWENPEAHQASLELEIFKNLINQAKPIIAGMNDYPNLTIKGGKATF